jgi:hypothetical protein
MDPRGPDESFGEYFGTQLSALQDRKCDCIFIQREERDLLTKVVPQAYTLVLI